MLLAVPIAAGLIVGKLTGGTFKALAETPLRWVWALLAGLGVQLLLFNPMTDTAGWDLRYGHTIYLLSLLLILAGLSINLARLRWPVLILTAGAALNFIAIAANGGTMPADAHALGLARGHGLVAQIRNRRVVSNVSLAGPSSRLAALDDHIVLPLPIHSNPYSLGDILISIGGFSVVIAEMHRCSTGRSVKRISAFPSHSSAVVRSQ